MIFDFLRVHFSRCGKKR